MILLGLYSTLFYSYCLTHFYYGYRYNINLFQLIKKYNTSNTLDKTKDKQLPFLLKINDFFNEVNTEISYQMNKDDESQYNYEELLINKNNVLLELIETVNKKNINQDNKNEAITSDNEYELVNN